MTAREITHIPSIHLNPLNTLERATALKNHCGRSGYVPIKKFTPINEYQIDIITLLLSFKELIYELQRYLIFFAAPPNLIISEPFRNPDR